MVIALVFQFPPSSSVPIQQQLDAIARQIETVGGERTGTYSVTCDLFVRTATGNEQQMGAQRGQRTVSLVQHGSYPLACLCIIENGNYSMCDASMRALMGKLDFFNIKPESRAEVFGTVYTLAEGDMAVRVGAVQSGASKAVRGILVEVEYGPCCVLADGIQLLREFAVSTFSQVPIGSGQPIGSKLINTALDASLAQLANPSTRRNPRTGTYDVVDTLFQYFEHFVLLRKTVGSAVGQAAASAPSSTSQPTSGQLAGAPQMPSPAAHNSPHTVRR